jgi:hypothetical protein
MSQSVPASSIIASMIDEETLNQIRQYTDNVNAQMEEWAEEAREHAGELVARTLDGRSIVTYAADEEHMQKRLAELGVGRETVVVGLVEP